MPCVTRIQTESNTVNKHGCLALVQSDTHYSREATPVFEETLGRRRGTCS